MDQIRVGVVGCGYWGPNLIRNLAEMPEVDLVAVADLRPERLARIAARYPYLQVMDDYWKLFDLSLDGVVVATPPTTHFRIAGDCLRHGLGVFVEKPLTLSSRDAEELIAIAEERDLRLMVGHIFEYNAAVEVLKGYIQRGDLGRIYYVDAVRVNLGLFQQGLDVLWDLAPHDISILLYLLDSEPVLVSAVGADCIFKGKSDIAYLAVEFADGTLAHLRISWLDPRKVRHITVVGSDKMVVYDDLENVEKLRIYDKGIDHPIDSSSFGEFQCSYRHGDVLIPNIPFSEPLRNECRHFVDCIRNGTQPRSNGYVGLKVVRVLEAAERSLYQGGTPSPIDMDLSRGRSRPASLGADIGTSARSIVEPVSF